jgi:hypothetical protein
MQTQHVNLACTVIQALLNWDEKSFKLQNCFQPNDFEISRNLDVITVHARFTCCVCIGYKTASTLNDRSCNSFHFKKKLAKKKATSKRTYLDISKSFGWKQFCSLKDFSSQLRRA